MNDDNVAALKVFVTELKENAYAARTISSYTEWASRLGEHLGDKSLKDANVRDVDRFLRHLQAQKYGDNSIRLAEVICRKLLGLPRMKFTQDRSRRVIHIKGKIKLIQPSRIIAVVNNMPAEHRLSLALLFGLGLRRDTLTNIRYGDVNLSRKSFAYYEADHSRWAHYPIPAQLIPALEKQMMRVNLQHEWDTLDGIGDSEPCEGYSLPLDSVEMQPLFQGRALNHHEARKPRDPSVLRKMLVKACSKANTPLITMTDMRYTYIALRIIEGWELGSLAKMCGFYRKNGASNFSQLVKRIKMNNQYKVLQQSNITVEMVLDQLQLEA